MSCTHAPIIFINSAKWEHIIFPICTPNSFFLCMHACAHTVYGMHLNNVMETCFLIHCKKNINKIYVDQNFVSSIHVLQFEHAYSVKAIRFPRSNILLTSIRFNPACTGLELLGSIMELCC